MGERVEIVLDRPREVRFTWADLKVVQGRLGKPLGDVMVDMGRLDVVAIQHLLFVGLRHDDPRLRFEDVGDLIEKFVVGGKTVGDLLYALNEAFTASGYFGREEVRKDRDGDTP